MGIFFVPVFYLPIVRDGFNLPKEVFFYCILSFIFILTLFEIIKTRTFFYKRTILDKPFLVLASVGLISTIFSKNPTLSFWGRGDTFVFHFFVLLLFLLWSWILIQKIQSEKLFRIVNLVFLVSGTCATSIFLLSDIAFLAKFFHLQQYNLVANLNSIFGIFVAVLCIVALGVLIPQSKENKKALTIVSSICALTSFLVLVRLDFQILWGFLALGLGLLFLLGMAFWGGVRKIVLGILFSLFLFSLIHLLIPGFLHFGRVLPTEINLTPTISKTIVESTLITHSKNFLFGSGPGTFVYDFSLFRPLTLNQNSYFWNVRFDAPWSSLFAWVGEFGFVGTVSLFFIFLLILGSVLSAILHIRSNFWQKTKFFLEKLHFADFHFEYFVFMIAWILLTLGIFISVYNFTLWFVWWTMLSFVVVGLSYIQPSLVHEHESKFEINSQYIFVFSFFFLVLSAATLFAGVYFGKIIISEYNIFQAQKNPQNASALLNKALESLPDSSDTLILLSKNYLEESMRLASSNVEESARFLSKSIDVARQARERDPENIRVYEILSLAYLQTLPYTSEVSLQQSLLWTTDVINHALLLEPSNPTFHSQMGVLQEFSGQLDLAKLSYEEAIRLKIDSAEGYFDLSRLYEKQNDLDHAIDVFEKYRTIDAKNPDVLYELGRLYYNRKKDGDDKKAEKTWLLALQIAPNASNTLYSLGLLYERRGENILAKEYLKKVKVLNPNNKDLEKKLQSL